MGCWWWWRGRSSWCCRLRLTCNCKQLSNNWIRTESVPSTVNRLSVPNEAGGGGGGGEEEEEGSGVKFYSRCDVILKHVLLHSWHSVLKLFQKMFRLTTRLNPRRKRLDLHISIVLKFPHDLNNI